MPFPERIGRRSSIPERDDQITHRRKKPGRPIDFGDDQKVRYRGRNVVERCFNKLKQWRGIAMRSDKTVRNYHAGLCLAATLHWLTTGSARSRWSGVHGSSASHPSSNSSPSNNAPNRASMYTFPCGRTPRSG